MSFRSLYLIQKETSVTQGITPLNCKTSSGRCVTAALGKLTFRNLCKSPSIGNTASADAGSNTAAKAAAQDPHFPPPTLTRARAVFTGHAPVTDGAWHMLGHAGGKSRDDNMSCPENWPLSLPAWSWHQSRCRFPLLQLFCYLPCETITSGCATFFPSFCPWLSPAARYGSEEQAVGAQLSEGGWPQTNGFPGSLGLAHAALLSGLFSSLHRQWCLSLCLPHVITWTDEKAPLSVNTIINLLGIWFWSI